MAFSSSPNPGGSNTVTALFTSTQPGYAPAYCGFAEADPNGDVLLGGVLYADASPEAPKNPALEVFDSDVPDGTYTVQLFCYTGTSVGDQLVD